MTKAQQRALNELMPRYGLDPGERLDLDNIFGRKAPRTLEIGFGNGDSLAIMAGNEPGSDFIGIEVHRPGVGHFLMQLQERGLENVRVLCADAVQAISDCLPDDSLDRVLLFFPDPWPKKRHHKRRIVQPYFIELLAARLKPGGILHMATDWEDYAVHMLEVVTSSPAFRNTAGRGHYSTRPDWRPVTKFEMRGQRLGHGVWDLIVERL